MTESWNYRHSASFVHFPLWNGEPPVIWAHFILMIDVNAQLWRHQLGNYPIFSTPDLTLIPRVNMSHIWTKSVQGSRRSKRTDTHTQTDTQTDFTRIIYRMHVYVHIVCCSCWLNSCRTFKYCNIFAWECQLCFCAKCRISIFSERKLLLILANCENVFLHSS